MKKLLLALCTLLATPAFAVTLESQGWWRQNNVVGANEPEFGRHIHLSTEFPLNQVVSGVVNLPIRVQLHEQPGTVKFVRVQLFDAYTKTVKVNFPCTIADCDFTVNVPVDTTQVEDGLWEWRLTANIAARDAAFGQRFFQTTRWNAFTENGNPPSTQSANPARSPGAAGWYEGVNYANVFCGPEGFNFVTQPQSGTVSLTCRTDRQTFAAYIDPHFHVGDKGIVLLETTAGKRTITINTNTLSNGFHRLQVRGCAISASGELCGVLALPFTVQN
jgi:hypothetical protein